MEKEKRSQSYKESRLDQLSEEKIAKITKFAKDYINKMLYKMKKSRRGPHGPSSSTSQASSTSMVTPNSADGVDVVMADITVEEHPEMNDGSDSGSDGEGGEGVEKDGEGSTSPSNPVLRSPPAMLGFSGSVEPTDCPMVDLDEQQRFGVPTPSDPRRRPLMGGTDCAWELPQLEVDVLSAKS